MKINRKVSKTTWYILTGVLVVLAAAYILTNEQKDTFQSNANFSITDTAQIGQIFIADKSGRKTLFQKKGYDWYMNDSLKANGYKVRLLLKTLKQLTVRQPVSEGMKKVAVENLASLGIKVELFDTLKRHVKTMYIGGPTNDMYGTYAILEGEDQPFIVHILGFNGYITPRFQVNINEWRDLRLTACKPKTLISVSVEYPSDRESDFSIKKGEGKFLLESQQNITPDSAQLYNYLSTFGNYYAATLVFEYSQNFLDSLNRVPIFGKLTIKDSLAVNTKTLTFYTQTDTTAGFMFARVEPTRQIVKMQWGAIRRSLVKPSYFLKPKKEDFFYQ